MKFSNRPSKACFFLLPAVIFGLQFRAQAATVGWWRFEEGAPGTAAVNPVLDSSGHGLSATPTGGPTFSSDVSPLAGGIGSTRSMHFDGYNTGLFVPDQSMLQLSSLTIEAFFKSEPMLPGTGGGADLLVRGDNRPGLDPYRITLNQPGNGLVFQIQDGADNVARLDYTVPFDQWIYVAGTFDAASGRMDLYINGQLVNSTITSIRPLLPLDPFYSPGLGIGSDPTGQYGEHLNGWLDEVRLSDRALSPQELLIPEPGTLSLLGLAAAALAWRRRNAA